jgi:hypothetical protein
VVHIWAVLAPWNNTFWQSKKLHIQHQTMEMWNLPLVAFEEGAVQYVRSYSNILEKIMQTGE